MLGMTFGQKVLTLRKQKGWSQRDLVKEIGEGGPSTVSAWESGAIPAMDVALKVARALGVPLDYLADDTQEQPPGSGTTDPERQLAAMIERFGAERVLWRLVEVGMGETSAASGDERHFYQQGKAGIPEIPKGQKDAG